MKAERLSRSGAAVKSGVVNYVQRAEAAAPVESVGGTSRATISATVLGIPESEFTPRVRDAIMKLMDEVQALRRELRNAKVRLEDAEREADQDQLLPVLNRRAFVRELTRHIAYSSRYGTQASLVYFDLDGFKLVNDTHGHAAGDAVLSHFAETLARNVRDSDVVGRLGGDEFGIILAHVGQEQANRKASSLRDALRANPAVFNGQTLPVGVSFGALELKAHENAEGAMARADEAMYARKRAAR